MAMLPETTITALSSGIDFESQPTKTYIVNWESKQIVRVDDGIDAMSQAVDIILNTTRYRWQIYSPDSGVELNDLVGKDFDFVESELFRRLKDAFSVDSRILRIENYKLTRGKADTAVCAFDVITTRGTVSKSIGIEVAA